MNALIQPVFKAAPLLVTAAMLTGCIHFDHSLITEPLQPSRSLAQRQCCDSLLELKAHPLPLDQYVTLTVGREDSVIEFRSGKSFTKALELPKLASEYLLQFDSVVNYPRIDLFPEAMYPMVTLLDANLNPVAIYDNETLDLRKPVFGPNLLRIILTVEPGSAARYALIHTSAGRTAQGLSVDPPYEVVQKDNFDGMLYGRPSQSRKKIHFSETGMVNVLAYSRPD